MAENHNQVPGVHNLIKLKDSDHVFSIDAKSRTITNESGKTKVMQYDHNSECFRFVLDKEIEGHDMLKCNLVQIHWYVIGAKARDKNSGVVEVLQQPDDAAILHQCTDGNVENHDNKLEFEWLLTDSVTQYAGTLNFVVVLACIETIENADGTKTTEVLYRWCSDVNSSVSIGTGINSGDAIAEKYPDILNEWRDLIDNHKLICENKIDETLDTYMEETDAEIEQSIHDKALAPVVFATEDEIENVLNAEGGSFVSGRYHVYSAVDEHLNEASKNPVQNRVIKALFKDTIGDSYVYGGEDVEYEYEDEHFYKSGLFFDKPRKISGSLEIGTPDWEKIADGEPDAVLWQELSFKQDGLDTMWQHDALDECYYYSLTLNFDHVTFVKLLFEYREAHEIGGDGCSLLARIDEVWGDETEILQYYTTFTFTTKGLLPAFDILKDHDDKISNLETSVGENADKIAELESKEVEITVDSELSDTSENPVQNKVITEALRTLNSQVNDNSDVINLLEIGTGANLFNVDTVIDGKFINAERVAGDKSALQDSVSYSASDWIEVEPSTVYIIHATNYNVSTTIHFCDDDDVLVVNSLMIKRDAIFITPANCTKIRFSAKTTIIKSGEYMFVKAENLFNGVSVTTDMVLESGAVIGNNSNTISSSGYSVSDWIEVDNNTRYVVYCPEQITIHFCDDNNILTKDVLVASGNNYFSTTANCTKIRFSAKTEILNSNDFQFAKAKTIDDYEEYLYIVKNEKLRIERYENMLGDIEAVLESVVGGV